MLTEERFASILQLLQEKKAITVTELTKRLNTSESTIRRDLASLDEMGKLKKVHGGATVLDEEYSKEDDIPTKQLLNVKEKIQIARYAATQINDTDFVYIDAGTTTEFMIDAIEATKATFVTNGITHARKLIQRGCNAYILGGQLKLLTEAIIGSEGISNLKKYNFTKCFLGANGIKPECGYSTPDIEEALMKREAISHSHMTYILADHTKFGKISSVSFGNLEQACVITDYLPDDNYKKYTVIKEVMK